MRLCIATVSTNMEVDYITIFQGRVVISNSIFCIYISVNHILNEINEAYDNISDLYKELGNVFMEMGE